MNEAKQEKPEKPEEQILSEEQAADLARLRGAASEQVGPEVAAQPERVGPSTEDSLSGLLQVVGSVAGVAGYSRVHALWNEQTCRGLAERAVPVLRKYPWGGKIVEFLDGQSGVEEIALVMFVLPVALGTVRAVREDVRERGERDEKEVAAKEAGAVPGGVAE